MKLIDSMLKKPNAFHRERLMKIDRFDYWPVAKKVSRDMGGLPTSYLEAGIWNLKLYYAVALLDPLNRHAVSRPLDPFWHSHVLFTRAYKDYCQSIFGHYIHHEPLDPENQRMVNRVARLYDYTLTSYRKLFRPVDGNWWPHDCPGARGPICYHNTGDDTKVMENALLPRNRKIWNAPLAG